MLPWCFYLVSENYCMIVSNLAALSLQISQQPFKSLLVTHIIFPLVEIPYMTAALDFRCSNSECGWSGLRQPERHHKKRVSSDELEAVVHGEHD